MPTDRVLIEIVTAANMAGVTEAKAGMLGLSPAALALGATLGGVVMVSKDMIKIAEEHDAAERGLAQAYQSSGTDLGKYRGQIDVFINSNRAYIDNQAEVLDGFAKLTRSGLSQSEVMRAMNDAVDLAALKHISLSDAVTLLDNAEHGRMRGLIDLGITTAQYTDAQGNLILKSHSVAQAMAEIDQKVKDGRKSKTDDQKATDELGNHWQDFARGPGKQLEGAFTDAKAIASLFIDMMGKQKTWDDIDGFLMGFGNTVKNEVTLPLQLALSAAQELAGAVGSITSGSSTNYVGSNQRGFRPGRNI